MILLALALQATTAPAPTSTPAPAPAPSIITGTTASDTPVPAAPVADNRYQTCLDLATNDPKAARDLAERYRLSGGGAKARECLGLSFAQEDDWRNAALAFEAAAREADGKDPLIARYWSQAGNAWLAAGDPVKAHAALDAALQRGTLTGQNEGEALLDRARTLVAAGELAAARTDLDAALDVVPADPLAWLLSATLARRMNDLPRAKGDIAEALKRSADDASVQLEAGNIAALDGNEDGAKAAWNQAIKLAPTSPMAASARKALAQFDEPAAAPPADPKPATK